jgi:hypothetical protein
MLISYRRNGVRKSRSVSWSVNGPPNSNNKKKCVAKNLRIVLRLSDENGNNGLQQKTPKKQPRDRRSSNGGLKTLGDWRDREASRQMIW